MTMLPALPPLGDDPRLALSDSVTEYGIYFIGLDGRIGSWNPGATRVTGYGPEDMLGQSYRHLFEDHGEAQHAKNLLFARDNRHLREEQWRRHRSGRRFLAAVTLDLIRDRTGAIAGFVEVVHDITEARERERSLYEKATRDPMTGVYNRGHFFSLGELEIDRAKRFGDPLSVALLDIDHFKKVNDTYGHDVGDLAIMAMARQVALNIRKIDTFARVGGEEFALLLPRANDEVAQEFLQRIRLQVAETAIAMANGTLRITISIGVAQLRPEAVSLAELMKWADLALYRAKQQGRNQVQVWRPG